MAEIEDLEVTEPRRFYIAGPMRGVEDHNYPRFQKVADYIRAQGSEVFSPHEAYEGDQGRPLADYYLWNLLSLIEATDVVFLPGWHNSSGARIEYLIAKDLGLQLHQAVFMLNAAEGGDEYVFDVFDGVEAPVELEAGAVVRNGAREAEYGPPLQDFTRTVNMWASLGIATSQDPADMALAMTALKLSRLKGSRGHYDSIVDGIGYLICYARMVREG